MAQDSIQNQLKKLEAIATWFEKEDDFDIEEGLVKVREGADLVKALKERIQAVENEFRVLEQDLKVESSE